MNNPPVIGIVGRSKTGKTTLIEKLAAELIGRGYRIGIIKHTFHPLMLDKEGTDSWRHVKAGARTVIAASGSAMTMVKQGHFDDVDNMLPYFSDLDLVLTEGFKKNEKPKIEVYNSKNPEKPLCILGEANNVFALVSDKVIPACEDLLTLTPDKITEIADLIEFRIGKNQKKGAHI